MSRRILSTLTLALTLALAVGSSVHAQDKKIKSAESAGPASLAKHATVMDWDGTIIREGSNGWTCLPNREDTPGADPWCVNEPWLSFVNAYVNKTEPEYDKVGIAYMLAGDTGTSNTDPYATGKTADNDWVEGLGAHIMLLVPDLSSFANLSSDPNNGGPWIMWPDTPLAHIMVPIDSYPPK